MDAVWEKVVSLQPEYLLLNDRNYEYWRQGAWDAGQGWERNWRLSTVSGRMMASISMSVTGDWYVTVRTLTELPII